MEIKDYLTEDILKRFKVFNPSTLFPPTPEELKKYLKEGRCPLCYRKLYWQRDGKIARCKSKAKDKFFIKRETYLKLSPP